MRFFLLLSAMVVVLGGVPAGADVIVDNGGPGTSYTGTWRVSGADDYFGSESVWARDGATYSWRMDSQPYGTYEVFMWWSGYSSRSASVAVRVEHEGLSTSLSIDQSQNSGKWNSLGTFRFTGSGRVTITASYGSSVSTCADAVWFQQVSAEEPPDGRIIDNRDSATSRTGTWSVSGASGYYGVDSVWSRDGTKFNWHFTPAQSGSYEVSMWWTEWPSRSTSVPVRIEHAGGSATVSINQQQNGGRWNALGSYSFNAGDSYAVTVTSQPGPSSTCADAVKFTFLGSGGGNSPPVAEIGSISPNPAVVGQSVTFVGSGRDEDGSIAEYRWASDIDGAIGSSSSFSTASLSVGNHTITLVVVDNGGAVSEEAVASLTVEPAAVSGIVIDNRDSATSRTGTWSVSGASGYYGVDSVWSRDGAKFNWHFRPVQSGSYEVSMWWTEWPSRSTSVPVRIEHGGGSATVTINQQQNGGRWNVLGSNFLQAGTSYAVTVTSQPGPSSTCADAVKFTLLGSSQANISPVAVDDSAVTTEGDPVSIPVTANDYDPDGSLDLSSVTITAPPGHGTAAVQGGGKVTYSPLPGYTGADSFRYRVSDSEGAVSNEAEVSITIEAFGANMENIYVCVGYSTTTRVKTNTIAMLQNIGASLQDGRWIYERDGKVFIVHMVEDPEGMKQALKARDAHVIFHGHSNYGLGAVFATPTEFKTQVIHDILYVDDDRIINFSSPWIGVKIEGMRKSQAYPNWWPFFKDGTSAIMPYTFDDPYGDPPYNYYITYRIPGDPTWYKIETAKNGALERFAASERAPWYDAAGGEPDPNNPAHRQYYITPEDPWHFGSEWSPSFELVGAWARRTSAAGYFRSDYYAAGPGTGSNRAIWRVPIPEAGRYRVSAWWPSAAGNALNAPYRVNHAGGFTTVRVNQRVKGGMWNELGTFNFNAGAYTISLSDNDASGAVMADAVRVEHLDNPPDVIKADFNARNRHGPAPLEVIFDSEDVGEVTRRSWDFGEGATGGNQGVLLHSYLEAGTYTVTYTVEGPLGMDTVTKPDYIRVGVTAPVLQAEFSVAGKQHGPAPLKVDFENRSSGDVTAWEWAFGDGAVSHAQNPSHTYLAPGLYDVSLTVTDNLGMRVTETKQGFIRAVIFDEIIDNMVYPAAHHGNRTILFRLESEIAPEEMRYKRLVYVSCSSGFYYADTFQRGVMFYTLATSSAGSRSVPAYLQAYLEGKSDEQIWRIMQNVEPLYDYYNFDLKPSDQW